LNCGELLEELELELLEELELAPELASPPQPLKNKVGSKTKVKP